MCFGDDDVEDEGALHQEDVLDEDAAVDECDQCDNSMHEIGNSCNDKAPEPDVSKGCAQSHRCTHSLSTNTNTFYRPLTQQLES